MILQLGYFERTKVAAVADVKDRYRNLRPSAHVYLAEDLLAFAGDGCVGPGFTRVNVEVIGLVLCEIFSVL